MFDVNDDSKLTVADKYYVAARKAGRFPSWRIAPDVRIFTTTEYNAIKAATTNVRSTYPGVTSYTTASLTSGGTLNLYLIAPGYAGQVTY
jgi:subtilisin-like proprotein convertase family protein